MDFPGLISCFASSVLVIRTFIIPTRTGQHTNISLAAEVKFLLWLLPCYPPTLLILEALVGFICRVVHSILKTYVENGGKLYCSWAGICQMICGSFQLCAQNH